MPHERFAGAQFASIVFCGGDVRGDSGWGGVGIGLSDKLFCLAGVDRFCSGANGAGVFSTETDFYGDSTACWYGAGVF